VDLNIIKKLIEALEKSSLKKLHVKEGDHEISLEKEDSHYHEKQVMPRAPIIQKEIELEKKETGKFITSPMVGTFYATPSPDQPVFVEIGDNINKSTVVCIIEAMKVMNEVKATEAGVIVEILVGNGQPVEFGTKLFRIE
jgi:acetyl-CoA carboxylase biotin carboxyl carrier protein